MNNVLFQQQWYVEPIQLSPLVTCSNKEATITPTKVMIYNNKINKVITVTI